MRIRFYGVRGSIPAPLTDDDLRKKQRETLVGSLIEEDPDHGPSYLRHWEAPRGATYGGNTSCVEVCHGETVLVLDAGTGLRVLGERLMQDEVQFSEAPLYLLISHFHWDHIQGFPFFEPAYLAHNRIQIWGGLEGLEEAVKLQMSPPFFPVSLAEMGADISFHQFPPGEEVTLGDLQVSTLPLVHPGGGTGFKVSANGKCLAYLTDTEVLSCNDEQRKSYREFIEGCNVLIADTQYEPEEAGRKMDWGHSSAAAFLDLIQGIELETFILFHYDPKYDDEKIDAIISETLKHKASTFPEAPFRMVAAFEGLEMEL